MLIDSFNFRLYRHLTHFQIFIYSSRTHSFYFIEFITFPCSTDHLLFSLTMTLFVLRLNEEILILTIGVSDRSVFNDSHCQHEIIRLNRAYESDSNDDYHKNISGIRGKLFLPVNRNTWVMNHDRNMKGKSVWFL